MWPCTSINAPQLPACGEHAISPLGDPVPLPVKWGLDLISSSFLELLANQYCAEHYLGYTVLFLENLSCDQEDILSNQQIYFRL